MNRAPTVRRSFREILWRRFQEESMAIQKVGVVGCGLMGSGIAQTCCGGGVYDGGAGSESGGC